MASISINSIIANMLPGRASPATPAAVRYPASPAAEKGVVFTRTEPGRNRTDSTAATGYTRKDAMGQPASAPQADSEPQPGQSAETGSIVAEKKDIAKGQTVQDSTKKPNGEFLTKAEMALLRELQKADQAVKAHEMAHLAAAGGYAKGGASFSYQRGPDGQNYAIGGEVQVDTGKEATPEATIQKMQIIRQAALAPVDPSPQDQLVAAHATVQISEAFKELQQARLAQPEAGLSSREATGVNDDTVRGIYQDAARGLEPGATITAGVKSKKNYAAYSNAPSLSARSDHQGLHQIA